MTKKQKQKTNAIITDVTLMFIYAKHQMHLPSEKRAEDKSNTDVTDNKAGNTVASRECQAGRLPTLLQNVSENVAQTITLGTSRTDLIHLCKHY